MQLYGSASAEPFFCCPPSRRTGEHDCASPAVAPQGASRRRSKSLLKHRVQGAALPAMLPSSPSADYISDATLRLCFGRAVFLLPTFPENWGARLRISGGCPARGEPEALINPCSSIACRAQPCQRCSPVLQALIISQYATLRLCFGRAVFCWLYLATVEPLHSNLCRGSVTFYFSFRSFSR